MHTDLLFQVCELPTGHSSHRFSKRFAEYCRLFQIPCSSHVHPQRASGCLFDAFALQYSAAVLLLPALYAIEVMCKAVVNKKLHTTRTLSQACRKKARALFQYHKFPGHEAWFDLYPIPPVSTSCAHVSRYYRELSAL